MAAIVFITILVVLFVLTFVAWRRYLWAAEKAPHERADTCAFSLTDTFGDRHLVNVPHQEETLWLTEVFSRCAGEATAPTVSSAGAFPTPTVRANGPLSDEGRPNTST